MLWDSFGILLGDLKLAKPCNMRLSPCPSCTSSSSSFRPVNGSGEWQMWPFPFIEKGKERNGTPWKRAKGRDGDPSYTHPAEGQINKERLEQSTSSTCATSTVFTATATRIHTTDTSVNSENLKIQKSSWNIQISSGNVHANPAAARVCVAHWRDQPSLPAGP